MSGGELDYVYRRLTHQVEPIRAYGIERKLPQFIAFADHLAKVVDAIRDVEWVMSDDCGPDGADESIEKVFLGLKK